MIVVSIDPGKITGYVYIDTEKNDSLRSMEISNWFEVGSILEKDLDTDSEARVVMERFIINAGTHKKGVQDEPRDIIGLTKYITLKYTGTPVKLQTASEAKTFSTNEKLKKIGFWHTGGKGHANDAFRHLLVYMVNNRLIDAKELLEDK